VLAYDSATSSIINQTASAAGLATTTSLSSHTSNTSNPHSVTAAQTSAFAIANNLSEGTAATIRSNISAAVSGANGDITSLTNCPSITDNATMTIGTSNANEVNLRYNGSDILAWGSNVFYPKSASVVNLGKSGTPFNNVYADQFFVTSKADWAPEGFGYTTRRSLNRGYSSGVSDTQTALDLARFCADSINTMAQDLIDIGLFS